jgi:hypothetical protein
MTKLKMWEGVDCVHITPLPPPLYIIHVFIFEHTDHAYSKYQTDMLKVPPLLPNHFITKLKIFEGGGGGAESGLGFEPTP